jgi:16S rRNA (cytosine967-C5)-methyltransferase
MIAAVVADGRRPAVRDEYFDRVLLDAPCSGLGVLRRRPDARWRLREEDVDDLAQLQRAMLAAAARTLKPGGRLVFSVCTLTTPETIDIDTWAAAELPELVAETAPSSPWRPYGRGAILLPSDANTDGMFLLVFTKRAEPATPAEHATAADTPAASAVPSPQTPQRRTAPQPQPPNNRHWSRVT